MDFTLPTNFTLAEFECPCCAVNQLSGSVIVALQTIRNAIQIPMDVTSGYRCPKWNADPQVGGKPGSFHVQGLAVDIAIDPHLLRRILDYAPLFFNGIGFYRDKPIIHLDMRPFRAIWVE